MGRHRLVCIYVRGSPRFERRYLSMLNLLFEILLISSYRTDAYDVSVVWQPEILAR